MKNTERKDLGDHLTIHPKNMFDEAVKNERNGDVKHLNLPSRQRTRRRKRRSCRLDFDKLYDVGGR